MGKKEKDVRLFYQGNLQWKFLFILIAPSVNMWKYIFFYIHFLHSLSFAFFSLSHLNPSFYLSFCLFSPKNCSLFLSFQLSRQAFPLRFTREAYAYLDPADASTWKSDGSATTERAPQSRLSMRSGLSSNDSEYLRKISTLRNGPFLTILSPQSPVTRWKTVFKLQYFNQLFERIS